MLTILLLLFVSESHIVRMRQVKPKPRFADAKVTKIYENSKINGSFIQH